MAEPEVLQGKPVRMDDEKGIVRYTVSEREVVLTSSIVRKFFCPDADDLAAMAFMGFCRAHKLDPFAKEAYLTVIDNRPTIQVAYTTFMKRAERHRQYRGFQAGLVLLKDADTAPDITGTEGVVPAPLVALQGELCPPGYKLIGGWCKVHRRDRQDMPSLGVVSVADYIRLTKEGKVQKMWSSKQATMIRKTAIAHGFRDAFPDEVGDMRINEEYDAPVPSDDPVPAADRPTEAPQAALPPAYVPIFDTLGWNIAARVIFAAHNQDEREGLIVLNELLAKEKSRPDTNPANVSALAAPESTESTTPTPAPPKDAGQGMLDF